MSGALEKPSGASEVIRSVRPEGEKRILALDDAVGEPVAPCRTEHYPALRLRVHEHETDAGMLDEARNEFRMGPCQLFQARTARQPGKVDDAQAAGGENDHVGEVLLSRSGARRPIVIAIGVLPVIAVRRRPAGRRELLLEPRDVWAEGDGSVLATPAGNGPRCKADGRATPLGDLRRGATEVSQCLVRFGDGGHAAPSREIALHELLEGLAVALLEGRTLALAVV